MGYSPSIKVFLCYNSTNRCFRTLQNVVFFYHQFFSCVFSLLVMILLIQPIILFFLVLLSITNQDINILDANLLYLLSTSIHLQNLCRCHFGGQLGFLVHQIGIHPLGMIPHLILLLLLYLEYLFLHVIHKKSRMHVG